MKAFHMDKGFYGAAQLILPASTLQGLDCTFRYVVFLKKNQGGHPFPSPFLVISSSALQRRPNLCIPKNETTRPRSQFSTFMFLWAIHIFPGSVYLFFCSKIDGPRIRGICKSLQIYEELETRPSIFYSGNLCFEFSVKCLCSAASVLSFQSMWADFRFLFNLIRLAQQKRLYSIGKCERICFKLLWNSKLRSKPFVHWWRQ